jgi:hypothetical protein
VKPITVWECELTNADNNGGEEKGDDYYDEEKGELTIVTRR